MPSKYLIVGLGNIGAEYEHTRHNIGFDVVNRFVANHDGSWKNDRLADVAEIKWRGNIYVCIKPTTYMNLSGKAVKYWADKEKIGPEKIFVVVDDLALPMEKIRIRGNGSSAGHNGLKDIEAMLQTEAYPRVRFGMGNNYAKGQQADFVLGRWTMEERPIVDKKIDSCVNVIETFGSRGLTTAMNEFNKLNFK